MNGRFTDKTGVLGGGGPYNLDHGFGLWMLNEHYRFTRDRAWLARTAPALIAACDFVTRQRNKPPGDDLLDAADLRWGIGLLPPGHLEDPPEWHRWFAVNAYACRGMIATAEIVCKEMAHPAADRIEREANGFSHTLREALPGSPCSARRLSGCATAPTFPSTHPLPPARARCRLGARRTLRADPSH